MTDLRRQARAPSAPAAGKRSLEKVLPIRPLPAERALLARAAAQLGMKLAPFMLKASLAAAVRVTDGEAEPVLLADAAAEVARLEEKAASLSLDAREVWRRLTGESVAEAEAVIAAEARRMAG